MVTESPTSQPGVPPATNLRHDTGDKADDLRTVVRPACDRPDLGPEFTAWLKGFVAGLDGTRPARRDIAA
ncbi:hypothetical protein STAFG_5302 [Streptomyces afghaniensis 772]|uniref:Uncharacterized protein n=1 Tax=Streptomyces afghaniensis 772 TaxID=1283301 RepID=S4NGT1_9ACTN|nr:hypothetical protein STAFG_5302 [Streptomyces afghaniensis 772]